MMPEELEKIETELRRLPPSGVPPDLLARLRAVGVEPEPKRTPRPATPRRPRWAGWFAGWRGLAWATPVALVCLIWLAWRPPVAPAATPGIKADAVQVDHSLTASFDAVAELPNGEPVRFRCRQWQDELVLHDQASGVSIRQSRPRVEVVPVRFETY
jgi:hypothetical protein